MRPIDFFLQLLGVTVGTVLLLLLLGGVSELHPYRDFGWLTLVVFTLLSLAMFFTGWMALNDKSKQAFVRVSLLFTLIKMVTALVLVFFYHKTAEPSGPHFLFPFFVVYLIHTVFETRFMMVIGKYGILAVKKH